MVFGRTRVLRLFGTPVAWFFLLRLILPIGGILTFTLPLLISRRLVLLATFLLIIGSPLFGIALSRMMFKAMRKELKKIESSQ